MKVPTPLEALEIYLANDERLAIETKKHYKLFVKQFLKARPKELKEYDTNDIRLWLSALFDQGQKESTRCFKLAALKAYFTYCTWEEFIPVNISFGIKYPKVEEQLPKFLDPNSMFKLRESVNHHIRDRAIVEALFSTGLRASELIALKRVNLKDHSIWVENGKGLRERYVFCNEMCYQYLKDYLKSHDNDYVFITRLNKPFSRQGLWALIKHYVARAGLSKKVSTHWLRHSFATHLINRGMPMDGLQKLLGHKREKQTKRYANISNKKRKMDYDKYN